MNNDRNFLKSRLEQILFEKNIKNLNDFLKAY